MTDTMTAPAADPETGEIRDRPHRGDRVTLTRAGAKTRAGANRALRDLTDHGARVFSGGQELRTADEVRAVVGTATRDVLSERRGGTVTGRDPEAAAPLPQPGEFLGEDGKDADYLWAPDLDGIVRGLIATCPDALARAAGAHVRCAWQRQGAKQAGRPVWADIRKLGKLPRFLAAEEGVAPDYLLLVAADHLAEMTPTNRELEAIVFGQLCRIGIDPETNKPALRLPDFSGFVAELDRYGDWSPGLKRARRGFEQARLLGVE